MPLVNRDILVCVAGATPQIITETIYALAKKNPPVYINELFIITTKRGSFMKVSTAQAKIDLAELPFLRLREKIESNDSTFSELIKNSQCEIDNAIIQPKILVKLREREIKIASKTLTLSPVLLAIYAFFLKRKLVCSVSNNCALCNDCYVNINDLTERPLIDELALLYGMSYDNAPVKIEKFKENYSSKYSTENIRSYISKINHKISLTLEDNPMSQYFLIKTIRKYGSSLYGIVVDRRKIRIL